MNKVTAWVIALLPRWPSIIIYVLILVVLVIYFRSVSVEFLSFLAPNESDALSVMWQVHAAVISIGFTGLAITFQLLAEPPISAGPARRAVIHRLHFYKLLVAGVLTDVVIGAAAVWFRSDANVILLFVFAFIPSFAAIVATYWYSAHLFGRPHMVERFTVDDVISAVRSRTEAVVKVRQQASDLRKAVESHYNLTTVRPVDAGEEKLLPYTGPPGVVQEVDLQKLRDFSDVLSKVAGKSSADQEIGASSTALIRISIGDRVNSQSVAVELYCADEISEKASARLSRLVSRCFTVTDVKFSAEELLERELEDLQADVIAAVRDKRYAAAERGFDYYASIFSAIQDSIAEKLQELILGLDGSWRQLTKHLWEINEVSAQEDERTAMTATAAAYYRCDDALRHSNIEFFASAVQSYSQIWETCINGDYSRNNALEHLLVSFQNLIEYTVPHRNMNSATARACVQLATTEWLKIIEDAYAKDEKTWSERSLAYFAGLFEFEAGPESYRGHIYATLLELLAWMLYKQQVLNVDTGSMIKQIVSNLGHKDALSISVSATLRENHPNFRRWEMAGALPLKVQQVRSTEFLSQAAIIYLAKVSVYLPVGLTKDHYDFAQFALAQWPTLKDAWLIDWGVSIDQLEQARQLLESIVNQWKELSHQKLAAASLSGERINAFRKKVADELGSSERLINMLKSETEKVPTSGEIFGAKLSVPKDFFVKTDVLADPSYLGSQVGRGIRQSETARVLRELLQFGVSKKVVLSELQDVCQEWVQAASVPIILAVNSYEAYATIEAAQLYTGQDSSEFVPIVKVYADDISEQVVLLDVACAPRAIMIPETKDGLTELDGHQLSMAVMTEGASASDGTPLVTIQFGSRVTWFTSEDTKVIFLYLSDVTY